jgi:hypothetical protein
MTDLLEDDHDDERERAVVHRLFGGKAATTEPDEPTETDESGLRRLVADLFHPHRDTLPGNEGADQ